MGTRCPKLAVNNASSVSDTQNPTAAASRPDMNQRYLSSCRLEPIYHVLLIGRMNTMPMAQKTPQQIAMHVAAPLTSFICTAIKKHKHAQALLHLRILPLKSTLSTPFCAMICPYMCRTCHKDKKQFARERCEYRHLRGQIFYCMCVGAGLVQAIHQQLLRRIDVSLVRVFTVKGTCCQCIRRRNQQLLAI